MSNRSSPNHLQPQQLKSSLLRRVMYMIMLPSNVHTMTPCLQVCHNPASAFDAAADASLLLAMLTLDLLLDDFSLAVVPLLAILIADVHATLPECSMERPSAGTFATGTTEPASQERTWSRSSNCDMRSGRSSSTLALSINNSPAFARPRCS